MSLKKIQEKCENGALILTLTVPQSVKKLTSCEIFLDEQNFMFSCDYVTYRHHSPHKIDTTDLKSMQVDVDTASREFSFRMPVLSTEISLAVGGGGAGDKIENNYIFDGALQTSIRLLNLQRVTDTCTVRFDDETQKFDRNFSYGFACRFDDDTSLQADTLRPICRITDPGAYSPIQRSYQREADEEIDFCREQYKLNFVELQVPDGLENPAKFTFSCNDWKLDSKQKYSLKVISEKKCNFTSDQQSLIDCGLIDLLLAICYDVRSTQNDVTCESAWARTILTATLSYFEPVQNLRTIVESFLRRSLIYPLYRNYDLSRMCVGDAIEALQKGSNWITKQLLITYELFLTSEENRSVLNRYFIEDYIRYMSVVEDCHLKTLSRNLKNLLLNTTKKDLRLKLTDIETELLKELIEDIHLGNSDDSDDVSDESEEEEDEEPDDDEEDDDDEVANGESEYEEITSNGNAKNNK